MPAGSNAVLIRRSSATWSAPRRASRNGSFAAPTPCSPVIVPPKFDRGREDVRERLVGPVDGVVIVLIDHAGRVEVAVAGVPEGGDRHVVPFGDLVDPAPPSPPAAAGERSRPRGSSTTPAGTAPAASTGARRAAPPTARGSPRGPPRWPRSRHTARLSAPGCGPPRRPARRRRTAASPRRPGAGPAGRTPRPRRCTWRRDSGWPERSRRRSRRRRRGRRRRGREVSDPGVRRRRHGQQGQRDLGDHGERPLRPGEQPGQVIPGHVLPPAGRRCGSPHRWATARPRGRSPGHPGLRPRAARQVATCLGDRGDVRLPGSGAYSSPRRQRRRRLARW